MTQSIMTQSTLIRILVASWLCVSLQAGAENQYGNLPNTSQVGSVQADKPSEIPTAEIAFLDVINQFDKQQIEAILGEPSTKNDITNAKTGKLEASIWQYHYLNTDEKGEYYKTTELDFIDDKVVMVVFQNNDGEDTSMDLEAPSKKTKP